MMIIKGYPKIFSFRLVKEVLDDFFSNKQNTVREKIWAYKRGFLSSKIKEYGLTEDNYKFYLSDVDYYKLYPINSRFKIWIDDKITTKYILSPFDEYLPKYYCHLKNKSLIIPLIDGKTIKTIEDVIKLLEREEKLALKRIAGSMGKGFYKISYKNNSFYINDNMVNKSEFINFLSGLEDYLITEYIQAHTDIKRISNFGLNTLRVMVINEYGEKPIIANAFMRFGTKQTGLVDNASAGGIFAIVEIESGKYHSPKRMENNEVIDYKVHPDTNEKIEGILPYWDFIKEKLIEISEYLSEVVYMGFDIAITDNGFKIIEINSHQHIRRYQNYYPLLKENKATLFFKKLLESKVR